ncbi:hypothetical protein D0B32_00515 [Paraburkholderia sp. DHOC27]|nr:hypothetical protein D0B32_00515 [Paraburkholderia sp. DHOC27]
MGQRGAFASHVRLGIAIVVTAGFIVVAGFALAATISPAVVRLNNPQCLQEVASNAGLSVAQMFQDPTKHALMRQAVLICSQTPGGI